MKNRNRLAQLLSSTLLIGLAAIGCSLVSSCASNANLTTTEGATGAYVDNGSKIYPGASVTSANTSPNTTVSTISGTVIVLNQVSLLTGTVPATFKNTVAGQLAGDLKTYTMTAANMAQTILPQITALAGNAVALDNLIQGTASDWGIKPTTPGQVSTLASIVNIATKVGKDSTTLSNFLTGVQTTGTVSTPTAYCRPPNPENFVCRYGARFKIVDGLSSRHTTVLSV